MKLVLRIASDKDWPVIYNIRHSIYAVELEQYATNPGKQLIDQPEVISHYIVAVYGDDVVGFISITSPASPGFSVDKYFPRSAVPYPFDEFLYEIRALTVIKQNRHRNIAIALMFAAFRWVQSHGGLKIVAICRTEFSAMYRKAGLKLLNITARSGKVDYELSVANIDDLQKMVKERRTFYESLQNKIDWQLPYLFFAPFACYHGGSFFKAIGEDLQTLDKAKTVICADVLDAWFPPSPKVLETIQNNLSFLLQTSPPTHAEGLIKVIAAVRGIKEQCILPGAGSSNLIFLALKCLLKKDSRVLIIDPSYDEYAHVLEKVIHCNVTRFRLCRERGFKADTGSLLTEIKKGYDMVVLVNPNSPTGIHLPKLEIEQMLLKIPQSTIVWIDETYVDFVGSAESLELAAVKTENVIICKSMSKVYALSGIRAAYLCCSPHLIEIFKEHTPPWSISLPAQAAAIEALKDPLYYQERYKETNVLRNSLKQDLLDLGLTEVIAGVANFILFYLPSHFQEVNCFLERCRNENLFLRDVSNPGNSIGKNAVRIAVKDGVTNRKMINIIKKILWN